MKCAALLLLCRFAMAVEVDPDWSLLTDFTTEFAWDDTPIARMFPSVAKESGRGTIRFDLGAEQWLSTGDFSMTVPSEDSMGPHSGLFQPGDTITGHGEFAFDGTKTFASMRGAITAPVQGVSVEIEFCINVNVPPGLAPPPSALQPMASQYEQQVNQALASMPHSDGERGGQTVVIYANPDGEGPPASFALLPNGVPVDLELAGQPVLQFTGWTRGAGDIQEVACHGETSASDLLATPGGMELLERLDGAMAALGAMSQHTPAGKMLPPKPSLLVKYAAKEELARMRSTPSLPWAATAVLGGIAGALVSTGVAMAVLRPSRFPDRAPLISDNE